MHTQEDGRARHLRISTNIAREYSWRVIKEQTYNHFKEPLCTCASSCPLHWSFHARQVLENSKSLPVCLRIFLQFLQCLKVASQLQRTKFAADLRFSKGCRTGEVETCLYTCNHTTARTVGKMLIAPLKSGSCDHKKGVFALFRLMVSHGVLVG